MSVDTQSTPGLWHVWHVERQEHVPGLYTMEEAGLLADQLNMATPERDSGGIGWTANPIMKNEP